LIESAQQYLDTRWPGQTRVISYNDQILRIVTRSAPLASEIRLRQLEILAHLKKLDNDLSAVAITIR
jgi:hypothetical protein